MSLIKSTAELLINIEEEQDFDVNKGEDVSALIYATASMLRAYINSVSSSEQQTDATKVKEQAAEMFATVLNTPVTEAE